LALSCDASRDARRPKLAVWKFSEARPQQRGPQLIWSEAELADAWEQRRYNAHWLVDCCGRHLRVVFPGRRWGGPGPDFLGAVLAQADGTLVRGDIEVHLRASSWAGHRHARDPAYAQVVLHVVQVADTVAVDGRGQHLPPLPAADHRARLRTGGHRHRHDRSRAFADATGRYGRRLDAR